MASGLGQPFGREVAATANEVVWVRGKLGLSQTKFASLLGISENTLQNWEQGRRQPTGPAKVLIEVAARHPEDVALRRKATPRLSSGEVLSAVAAVLGVREPVFRTRSRDSLPRALAAWALVRYADLNQREAAGVLGLGIGAAVSQLVARWRQAVAVEAQWRTVGSELDSKLRGIKL